MYKLLLILKYLRRKLAPLFAALAVLVCTAMVIIVTSVMGGFLETWREAARRVTADVTLVGDFVGFPYYDELTAELEALDEVQAAAPVIYGAGMIKVGERVEVSPQVVGIRPEQIDRVLPFRQTLYWKNEARYPLDDLAMRFDVPGLWLPIDSEDRNVQGAVVGIEFFNHRRGDAGYDINYGAVSAHVTLTVVPVTQAGAVTEPQTGEFVVLNEIKSGMYDMDASQVYVPFERLQQLMGMEPVEQIDPQTGAFTGVELPGRASAIIVRGSDKYDLAAVQAAVVRAQEDFQQRHPEVRYMRASTWEEQHAQILNAVQNEKGMMTFLFVIISLVAVVMIATTFYMIVLEKTRDIGVLRAIGSSRLGIATIFLGYGIAIGVVGALLGAALGVTIVFNLNGIESILYHTTGWRMWNPETYYFDTIPEMVEWHEVVWISLGAVFSSLVGAVIPAFLAARLDPVESLRYE